MTAINLESNLQAAEETFLAELETSEPSTDKIIEILEKLHASKPEEALGLCSVGVEACLEKELPGPGLAILHRQVTWNSAKGGQEVRETAEKLAELDRDKHELFSHSGFDNQKPSEALRRLLVLWNLDRECLCHEKTWGFGVVQDVDLFYHQVLVDFDNKPGHQFSLAYAAETLELIDEEHLLARRHKDPEALKELVKNNAAEVVRIALRSYGPMPAQILQERLSPAVVEEKDWKRFWDAARKDLKKDPHIEIPNKRSEPILMLDEAKSYNDQWFTTLRKTHNLKKVLDQITELVDSSDRPDTLDEHAQEVLSNRLGFLIKGSDPKYPGNIARALMMASSLGVVPDGYDPSELSKDFLSPALLNRTMEQLPARYLQPFMRFLVDQDEASTLDLLAGELADLDVGVLTQAIETMKEYGREDAVREVFKQCFDRQEVGIVMVNWVCRNLDKMREWELTDLPSLGLLMLLRIEEQASGELLRAQNQLREHISKDEFFLELLGSMTPNQRYEFTTRLRDASGFETMDKRSLLGKAIKAYSELQEVTASRTSAEQEKRGPVTSNRTYAEKQAQLEKIMKVDIPENSKEIGVARSYGDLRENHEYKAAKEMQGILMRRQAELEKALAEVTHVDFRNFPADEVGVGTGVVLGYDDGSSETFYILGEWDRDEDLNIISCNARLAQVLEGHVKGDSVQIPGEQGERNCVIKDVFELPAQIIEWANTDTTGASE